MVFWGYVFWQVNFLDGAIFDVDGTILDSMSVWYDITRAFFQYHRIDISTDEIDKIQEMTLDESIPYIQQKYMPREKSDNIIREFNERLSFAYSNTIKPKRGVCEYILDLHNNGTKIAVATSGFESLCIASFKRIGIYPFIDAYAYSNEVGCNKTKPDIYLLAAERLNLKPEQCEVYEDIIAGVMSAKSAGFTVTAVADKSNAQDKERLIRHSDRYITGWNELLSKNIYGRG